MEPESPRTACKGQLHPLTSPLENRKLSPVSLQGLAYVKSSPVNVTGRSASCKVVAVLDYPIGVAGEVRHRALEAVKKSGTATSGYSQVLVYQ